MEDSSVTFKKVVGGILSYNENSHPWKALVAQDVLTIEDFLALDEKAIKKLSYTMDSGAEFSLSVGHQMKLVRLRRWAQSKGEDGIEAEVWDALTRQELAKFTIEDSTEPTASQGATLTPSPVVTPAVQVTTNSAVESFQKGIRRDPKDYNAFDDQGKFLMWRRHVITTARSHGIYNVLDCQMTIKYASLCPPLPAPAFLSNPDQQQIPLLSRRISVILI